MLNLFLNKELNNKTIEQLKLVLFCSFGKNEGMKLLEDFHIKRNVCYNLFNISYIDKKLIT